jgi:hypothetical protein
VAPTSSPRESWGSPITAASATVGCSWSTSSIYRVDVVAAADDQVLLAIDDVVVAILVDAPNVAGGEPPMGSEPAAVASGRFQYPFITL